MQASTFDQVASVKALKQHYDTNLRPLHLKNMLQDQDRNAKLVHSDSTAKIVLDYTHTKIDAATMDLLKQVAVE